MTSRGMREPDMVRIADWMDRLISAPGDEALGVQTAAEIAEFCRAFPAPGIATAD